MKCTRYFESDVLRRRPYIILETKYYIRDEWLERAIKHPEYMEVQPNGRIRHWIFVEALGKYFRVVTLSDGETVHTAFPDRSFDPENH